MHTPEQKSFLERLGLNIAAFRGNKGVSQANLARLTLKERQNINRLEKGKTNPTILFLRDIANALKAKLSELLHGL